MKERPIIMSLDHPLKILRGEKTLTQRVVKPQPMFEIEETDGRCPYGYPGDRLWVRETWAKRSDTEDGTAKAKQYLMYKASGGHPRDPMNWHDYGVKWNSPMMMPRWASRLTLELTDVKVRRVQDMTEADAIAEGFSPITRDCKVPQYAQLWDKINGRTHPWESNPWVWALYFKVIS